VKGDKEAHFDFVIIFFVNFCRFDDATNAALAK
jgi:hypothetical protein